MRRPGTLPPCPQEGDDAMHELTVCQALLAEVRHAARDVAAGPLCRVVVRAGPLSGVEPRLLARAFSLARAGTVAEHAELVLEEAPVRVHCLLCDAESEALPNRLLCGRCGGLRTRLVSGDELVLQRLEFRAPPAAAPAA
jgi:hydrogenase nickel incorporation protein HypA/HybF